MSTLRPALVIFASLSFLTGLGYPFLITGVGSVAFPHQAGGSLIARNGQVLGSELIGQYTEDPRYFWGRLSATSDYPTHAGNSGGSNLAPSHPDLKRAAECRIRALQALDPDNHMPIPVDLVTASGSGLDPHISPAAAEYQLARVARMRGLERSRLQPLVKSHTEGRLLGFIGEARVNVQLLNLDLDAMKP